MKRSPRLERKLADALSGNEVEVLLWYKKEIRKLNSELAYSRNSFRSQCIKQDIDTLCNEYDVISSHF